MNKKDKFFQNFRKRGRAGRLVSLEIRRKTIFSQVLGAHSQKIILFSGSIRRFLVGFLGSSFERSSLKNFESCLS